MATRKRRSTPRSGAWFALIIGMVLGVAAAVAVALFVTQAPMPFADQASRRAPQTTLPDAQNAPDPTIGLDRQSAVTGQSVSVCLYHGGSRNVTKKIQKHT